MSTVVVEAQFLSIDYQKSKPALAQGVHEKMNNYAFARFEP